MIHRLRDTISANGHWETYCGETKELAGEYHWVQSDDGVDCSVCKDQMKRYKPWAYDNGPALADIIT